MFVGRNEGSAEFGFSADGVDTGQLTTRYSDCTEVYNTAVVEDHTLVLHSTVINVVHRGCAGREWRWVGYTSYTSDLKSKNDIYFDLQLCSVKYTCLLYCVYSSTVLV